MNRFFTVIRISGPLLACLGQKTKGVLAAIPCAWLAFAVAWQVSVFLGRMGRLGACMAEGCEVREFWFGLPLFVAIFFLTRRQARIYVIPVAVLAAASCAGLAFSHEAPGNLAFFMFFLFITPTVLRGVFTVSIRPWRDFFKPFAGTSFNSVLYLVSMLISVNFAWLLLGTVVPITAVLAAVIWKFPVRRQARWVKPSPVNALPTSQNSLCADEAADRPEAAATVTRQGRVVTAFCISGTSLFLSFLLVPIYITPLAGYLALSSFEGQTRGVKTAAAMALLASAAVFGFQYYLMSQYRA